MQNIFKSCGLYRKVIINMSFMCKGNYSFFLEMILLMIYLCERYSSSTLRKCLFLNVAYFRCFVCLCILSNKDLYSV